MLKRVVFVWEWPIRVYHWLNVVLITILLLTGFYIGAPLLMPSLAAGGEAYQNFLMGQMRYWHGWAAWFFVANTLFRFYWAFPGNEYAKFKPWRKGFFADGLDTLKYYLFLKPEHSVHVGHNVLAQTGYFFIMWIGSVFMILTGFLLQGEINPTSWQTRYFGWLLPLFGNESFAIRSYHHLVAWLFVAFIIMHLYLAVRQDLLDDDGTVSSIINGHKFLLADGEDQHDKD